MSECVSGETTTHSQNNCIYVTFVTDNFTLGFGYTILCDMKM